MFVFVSRKSNINTPAPTGGNCRLRIAHMQTSLVSRSDGPVDAEGI